MASRLTVLKLLAQTTEKKTEDLEKLLEIPAELQMGDFALPCFRFAKEEKTSPQKLAQQWKENLNAKPLPAEISKIESNGGYLNFFLKRSVWALEVLEEIEKGKEKYGFSPPNQKTAVVEFSSPNIAKPFSIGHLRSTNLGASLARILEARGWNVVRMNHLGDWGTQFGRLISAYKRWGNANDLSENPIQKLYELYVRWHQEEENDPQLAEEARSLFSKLEQGDQEVKELWDWFRELTLEELKRLYADLSITFDYYWGESFYTNRVAAVLDELKTKKISRESDGATIVDLEEEGLSKCVLQKKDDSSLYLTRDIAAAIVRKERFQFNQMIYVVGTPQQLHFQQLFKILEKMGHEWSSSCEHVAFGHVSFGDEKMSTRKGNIVFLSDVISKAEELAFKIVEEKNPELENRKQIAKSVALAAILFADVSAKRIKDVKFSWNDILSFDGETGPYVQYTLVRTLSLLRKFEGKVEFKINAGHLESDEEANVIRVLSQFSNLLERAERDREPFYVAQYLIELAKAFNKFYTQHRILDASTDMKNARMWLVQSTANVLTQGLNLLGIPKLEKM